jgi:tetratricopeptide (TPR) repeat protein
MDSHTIANQYIEEAKSFKRQGDFENAIEAYILAIHYNPQLLQARMDLAVLYQFQYVKFSDKSLLVKAIAAVKTVIRLETSEYRKALASYMLHVLEELLSKSKTQ